MEMPWERRLRVLDEQGRAEAEKRERDQHAADVAAQGGAVWHWYHQQMQAIKKAQSNPSTMDVLVALFDGMVPAEQAEVTRRTAKE